MKNHQQLKVTKKAFAGTLKSNDLRVNVAPSSQGTRDVVITSALGDGTSVGLEQILAARERRAARQATALTRFNLPLVSITVVTPGPVKDGALPRHVLSEALRAIDVMCRIGKWPVMWREVSWLDTGPEALYAIAVESRRLKSAAIKLEDRHPLGRLWDLDVIVPGRRVLSRKELGYPARACLVCERPAFECGRSRRHPLTEVLSVIARILNEHDRRFWG